MQDWELSLFLDFIPYADRNEWQRTRFQAYYAISPYLKVEKTISEVFPMFEDEIEEQSKNTEITESDIARMNKETEYVAKLLQQMPTN